MHYIHCILLIILVIFILKCIPTNNKKYKILNKSHLKYDENNKMKIYDQCKYKGDGFDESHELGECSIAVQIIPYVENVLEIGGGTGKVSHIINKILKERNLEKKHIVVEPGEIGYGNHKDIIYKNKKKFNDKYTIIKKLCENLTMEDLKLLNFEPDCLYVDCEGCLHEFFKTKIGKYCLNKVRFIVNEQDSFVINKDIKELNTLFENNGFKLLAEGYGCGTNCLTDIWYRP